jgi:O-methyltransferase involved in polyketide biosynthesis
LPSLHKGLAQRHCLIDQRLRALEPCEVIELAAGLSARGLRSCRDPESLPGLKRYLELDLPHVIAHKRRLYQLSAGEGEPALPERLCWRGLDVTGLALSSLFERPRATTERRLLIAEGLMMYLDAPAQRALWREALKALEGGGVLVFDLVPSVEQPPPGLFGRLLGALMARFTGGATFTVDQRGREELCHELHELGFAEVKIYDTAELAHERGLPHPEAHTQQLIFEARAP